MTMDSSDRYKQTLKTPRKEAQEISVSNSGDVFQPAWFRRALCACDEMDRVFSDNRPYLLWHVGILFWLVLFIEQK